MSKPNESSKVLPHGLLKRLAENLYTVNAMLRTPLGDTTRRMTVICLAGRRLLLCNPIALRDEELEKLEALGKHTFVMGGAEPESSELGFWLARYPKLTVIAPPGRLERGDASVVAQGTSARVAFDLCDPRVSLLIVPGTNERELAALVESRDGKTLVLDQLVFNLPRTRGYRGALMRLSGFGPSPTIPWWVRARLIQDRQAVRSQLESWARLPGLDRIVMSHGEPIEEPRAALLRLASSLGGTSEGLASASESPRLASLSSIPPLGSMHPGPARRAG